MIFLFFILFHFGASMHARCKSGLHLVAYDADSLIFNKLLQPLWKSSAHNALINQSSKPLSLEEDEEFPRIVAEIIFDYVSLAQRVFVYHFWFFESSY